VYQVFKFSALPKKSGLRVTSWAGLGVYGQDGLRFVLTEIWQGGEDADRCFRKLEPNAQLARAGSFLSEGKSGEPSRKRPAAVLTP